MSGKLVVRIHSRMARALYVATWTLGLVATLGGMFDPTSRPDKAEIFPGAVFVVAEVLVVVRSLRIGLVIDDEQVTSRGILRTRTLRRDVVSRVRPTGYSGTINWGATSGSFMMLKLRVAEKRVELPHLIGPPPESETATDTGHALRSKHCGTTEFRPRLPRQLAPTRSSTISMPEAGRLTLAPIDYPSGCARRTAI